MDDEHWVGYMGVAKVLKDKCWYALWNFDLFNSVDRIYPHEGYYNSLVYLFCLNADKITDQIYLGSAFNAADEEWLKATGIDYVVNVTPGISNYYPEDFEYFNYSATDLDNSSLKGYYESFYRLIKENPDKKIFVHCFAGKSRSAALVLYYLMKEYDWTLDRALMHVKRCRPCINLNTTFISEILELLPDRAGSISV